MKTIWNRLDPSRTSYKTSLIFYIVLRPSALYDITLQITTIGLSKYIKLPIFFIPTPNSTLRRFTLYGIQAMTINTNIRSIQYNSFSWFLIHFWQPSKGKFYITMLNLRILDWQQLIKSQLIFCIRIDSVLLLFIFDSS